MIVIRVILQMFWLAITIPLIVWAILRISQYVYWKIQIRYYYRRIDKYLKEHPNVKDPRDNPPES